MAKVYFINRVKYEGEYYEAFERFEVKNGDIQALREQGAVAVEEPSETKADANPESKSDKKSKSKKAKG